MRNPSNFLTVAAQRYHTNKETFHTQIIARTKKEEADYYLPKINALSSQLDYLKTLLEEHNIPFNLENRPNT